MEAQYIVPIDSTEKGSSEKGCTAVQQETVTIDIQVQKGVLKKHYYIYSPKQVGKTHNARLLPNSVFLDSWNNSCGVEINHADFIIFDNVEEGDERLTWKILKRLTDGVIRRDGSMFGLNIPKPDAQIIVLSHVDPCTLFSRYSEHVSLATRTNSYDKRAWLSKAFNVFKPCAGSRYEEIGKFEMVKASDPKTWSPRELRQQISSDLSQWCSVDINVSENTNAFVQVIRRCINVYKVNQGHNKLRKNFIDIVAQGQIYAFVNQFVHLNYDENMIEKKHNMGVQSPFAMYSTCN